jgi:hypothetical protein
MSLSDLEISKALALAIGHEEQYTSMHWWPSHLLVCDRSVRDWKLFDYRDWRVIGPIAEKFECFPMSNGLQWRTSNWNAHYTDTPQKAIALAVIQGAKK